MSRASILVSNERGSSRAVAGVGYPAIRDLLRTSCIWRAIERQSVRCPGKCMQTLLRPRSKELTGLGIVDVQCWLWQHAVFNAGQATQCWREPQHGRTRRAAKMEPGRRRSCQRVDSPEGGRGTTFPDGHRYRSVALLEVQHRRGVCYTLTLGSFQYSRID